MQKQMKMLDLLELNDASGMLISLSVIRTASCAIPPHEGSQRKGGA